MGIRHSKLPIEGVQFHPESFLTENGHQLIQNWLSSLPGAGAP
jgi:para-aminobenzoate synthetase component 2